MLECVYGSVRSWWESYGEARVHTGLSEFRLVSQSSHWSLRVQTGLLEFTLVSQSSDCSLRVQTGLSEFRLVSQSSDWSLRVQTGLSELRLLSQSSDCSLRVQTGLSENIDPFHLVSHHSVLSGRHSLNCHVCLIHIKLVCLKYPELCVVLSGFIALRLNIPKVKLINVWTVLQFPLYSCHQGYIKITVT